MGGTASLAITPRVSRRRLGERLQIRLRAGHHGVLGAVLWTVFLGLALAGVEPVRTYYYVLAWYPALLVVDAWVARKRGWSLLSDRPRALFGAFAWSIPFWLVFEAINLRVENWYYIGAPRDLLSGRIYLLLSFATVLPGLVLVFDLLGAYGWFDGLRMRPYRTTQSFRLRMMAVGWGMVILLLTFPGVFYPLVWVFPILLLEPLCRRPLWPSLLKDLGRGRLGRIARLLLSGLLCGLYWEVMNMAAGARWIYTVPFFDQTLGVEMPPVGFLGFLPFALAGYGFLRVLEIGGLSAPFEEDAVGPVDQRIPMALRALAFPGAVAVLSLIIVIRLEENTIDARAPAVEAISGIHRREAAILALRGAKECAEFVALGDAEGGVSEIARRLVVPEERVQRLLAEARLAIWKGLGTEHAGQLWRIGVRSVEDLRAADPEWLVAALQRLPDGKRVRPQRVRVWCR